MKAILASFATVRGSTAGGGSKTLLVRGDVTAHPNIPDATQAADFTTDFVMTVSIVSANVTTGIVMSPAGAVPGSSLSVAVENEIDVIVAANPAL